MVEIITVREIEDQDRRPQPRGPVVNMISEGPTTAGTSKSSRKAYAQELLQVVGGPSKKVQDRSNNKF